MSKERSTKIKAQSTKHKLQSMIRIEINGRDDFWRSAVFVEWEHQYPNRTLLKDEGGSFLIENDWLEDLKRIAGDCFSAIVLAPNDPSRRSLFRHFLPREKS